MFANATWYVLEMSWYSSLAISDFGARRSVGCPIWDARCWTRWPQGPPRGHDRRCRLLPSLSTHARARRRQLFPHCMTHCVRLPAKERFLSWKRMRLWKESVELLQNVPTDGGSQAACVCHCVRNDLPSDRSRCRCARLPTVSTTGLPAVSCLGSVGHDFQFERTRMLLFENLLPHDHDVAICSSRGHTTQPAHCKS